MVRSRPRRGLFRRHSLSLVLAGVVVLWLVLYARADPSTHTGAFFGNALADWLGSLVLVVCTEYFYEIGSEESKTPPHLHQRVGQFVLKHSLSIVLGLTTLMWLALFARSDPGGKTGTVIGNIASEWTQILGLVVITKYVREPGAKAG